MSDDIRADAERLKVLAGHLHETNEQAGGVATWIDGFIEEVSSVLGSDNGAMKDLRSHLFFGQRQLREYREWMEHAVKRMTDLSDEILMGMS